MKPEYVVAIISLCGVVLTAVVSVVSSARSAKFSYKKLFAEAVSKNRMDWINVWRENIATFLAITKLLAEEKSEKRTCGIKKRLSFLFSRKKEEDYDIEILKLKKEQLIAKSRITVRLNLSEKKHRLMYSALNEMVKSSERDFQKLNAACEYVEQLARTILKEEWERVKREAKGEM